MAHIGLTPQSVNALGGYGVRGRDATEAAAVLADAEAMAAAGAFSVVIEKTAEPLAREITGSIPIRPSASAPRRRATGRSWSSTM